MPFPKEIHALEGSIALRESKHRTGGEDRELASVMNIRRLAITTGGGDAPGLNAVIRAAVVSALSLGWECVGLRDGMRSLLCPEEYPDGGLQPLGRESVRGITHLGGTILGTTNCHDPLHFPVLQPDGTLVAQDCCDRVVARMRELQLDALISIGGDGSMRIAARIAELGFPVVGVPKTIDNDLDGTVVTFGFDTAVEFATECIDRLHPTAQAHQRVFVVEVMGRYAGWIALEAGLAGTADIILLPEIPFRMDALLEKLKERKKAGFSVIVVAEGARPQDGERMVVAHEQFHNERLGGVALQLATRLHEATGLETRHVVLGHLLRGGKPTARDRIYSLRFGAAAVRALAEGQQGVMVALDPPNVRYIPLQQATGRMKVVPLDCDSILTLRQLGVCLGD